MNILRSISSRRQTGRDLAAYRGILVSFVCTLGVDETMAWYTAKLTVGRRGRAAETKLRR